MLHSAMHSRTILRTMAGIRTGIRTLGGSGMECPPQVAPYEPSKTQV